MGSGDRRRAGNRGIVIPSGSDYIVLGEPKNQANFVLFGDAGTGKTHLGCFFVPDPVCYLNLDRRAYRTVKRAIDEGRRILYTDIPSPSMIQRLSDDVRKTATEAVKKFRRNFEVAVRESQKGNVRAIVADTGTEFAEIVTLAVRGGLGRAKDYGESKGLINNELMNLFGLAREGKAHLVVLARAKSVWANNEPTGEFTYRGPEALGDAADFVAQIRLAKSMKRGARKRPHEIKITKAGDNITELGEVYTEEMWGDLGPFVYACMMQYPGTSPEDWE